VTSTLKVKPLTPAQQKGPSPKGCSKCRAPFAPTLWPRSKWTLNGFSPWCPQCHTDFAGDGWNRFNNRRKPGPKPKRQETTHA
jgi:hypothetical protein